MAKDITVEDVKRIADLANIYLTEDEAKRYAKQIAEILAYVEKLNEIDTKDLEFKSQVDLTNIFKKDEAGESLKQDEALKNRKSKAKNGSFVISSVINK